MDGTSTPFLHLSNLVIGVYKFVLKVTDTLNQSSTAEVHVFVKPENNEPPVANAGNSFKVTLPLENDLVLDGSQSHDDVGITKWQWEQVQGLIDILK
jgi:dyslexia-associated protein KIAA0319-like protein